MSLNVDPHALQETVAFFERLGPPPAVACVLGSGLGAFAEGLSEARSYAYAEIPHAPQSNVLGHAGRLILGKVANTPIAVLSGRVHVYEGHPLERAVFMVRALARWGVKRLLLTNAAGAVNLSFAPGDLMVIGDHLNFTGRNPLEGENNERFGPRFLDMTHTYDPALRAALHESAAALKTPLKEGVYAWLLGPSYETPAEIRMLRTLGADAVGMSTVPEAIAARHMGARVVGLSCLTNMGAGICDEALSHDDVKATADRVASSIIALFERAIPLMASR